MARHHFNASVVFMMVAAFGAAGQDVRSARPGPPPGVDAGAARPMGSGSQAAVRPAPRLDDSAGKSHHWPGKPPTADHVGLLGSAAAPALPAAGLLLTTAEERDLRAVMAESGIAIGHRFAKDGDRLRLPYDELVIPTAVATLHARKPQATLHVLLRLVEDGRPRAALLAAGCVAGLVKDPIVGAMYVMFPEDRLDDRRSTNETRRDVLLRVLGKMIDEQKARGGSDAAGTTGPKGK